MIVPSPAASASVAAGAVSACLQASMLSRNAGASWFGLPPWPLHTAYFESPIPAVSLAGVSAADFTAASCLQDGTQVEAMIAMTILVMRIGTQPEARSRTAPPRPSSGELVSERDLVHELQISDMAVQDCNRGTSPVDVGA